MKEKKKLSLPAWIFIGMLAGIAAGLIFAFAGLGDFTTEWIKPIGTIYVNLLKKEEISDIRKVYKSGVSDSVLETYRDYIRPA